MRLWCLQNASPVGQILANLAVGAGPQFCLRGGRSHHRCSACATEDFRDLIERSPDIYSKVMNQTGETLYTSKGSIRSESGRLEIMNVEIEKRGER